MIRTFKYPLYPNKTQEKTLNFWLERCCELYNAALYERIDAWRKQKKTITIYDQQKELTQIRKEHREWKEISVIAERSALIRLDRAFAKFFTNLKSKDRKVGFPRFKPIHRYNSFSLSSGVLRGDRINIYHLGSVKFHKYREMKGKILEVHIKRKCEKWYVYFVCDLGAEPVKKEISFLSGLDLGITNFVTLANGNKVENPKFCKRMQKKLSRAKGSFAKKIRTSNSMGRLKIAIGRIYEKVHNQKLDFARKLAKTLFDEYDALVVEDLNIENMKKLNKQMNKNIDAASWGIFINALACKAEEAGKHLVFVNPRNTSDACSSCGNVVYKELNERIHSCKICGLTLDRDHNAAINISILGRRMVPKSYWAKTFV